MTSVSEMQPSVSRERVAQAYLASSIGDCLGWPFEGHSKDFPSVEKWEGDFFAWTKRSGGRFQPYLEHIGAGEYSDDTQLILAVTRSRLRSVDWWNDFSQCELPFWTFYERGGGGATKRAATSWLTSTAPWKSSRADAIRKYLSAGGNGVAMRVLPHCAVGANRSDFLGAAYDIMTDGVITHGHPRALLGALAYGFALWYVLKLNRTLHFGELIQATIENVNSWGTLLSIEARWEGWMDAINASEDYEKIWHSTVSEMLTLLGKINEGIQAGALAMDDDVLDSIGARNIKTNGAGTVSAATAIYFASRYAASPTEGLRRAASAIGSDTDTNASMTGSLLGALSGSGWFADYAPYLQDRQYIETIARSLADCKIGNFGHWSPVRRADINRLTTQLKAKSCSGISTLPNGMTLQDITEIKPHVENSKVKFASQYKLLTSEGISLFYRSPPEKFEKVSTENRIEQEKLEFIAEIKADDVADEFIGLSLVVSNLENSLVFYKDMLGLSVSGKTSKTVRFGNYLAFKEVADFGYGERFITIFLQVSSIVLLHDRLMGFKYPYLSAIVDKSQRKSFTCSDPDGYMIEVVESKK